MRRSVSSPISPSLLRLQLQPKGMLSLLSVGQQSQPDSAWLFADSFFFPDLTTRPLRVAAGWLHFCNLQIFARFFRLKVNYSILINALWPKQALTKFCMAFSSAPKKHCCKCLEVESNGKYRLAFQTVINLPLQKRDCDKWLQDSVCLLI